MCFNPVCDISSVDITGTIFMPRTKANLNGVTVGSEDNVYAIPALGLSMPLLKDSNRLRLGLAAYGVSGLGVDYRGSALDVPNFFGPGANLIAGTYSSLVIMKVAPSIAYQLSPKWSVGLATHIDYATLDLGAGTSIAYAFGAQPGLTYRASDTVTLGLTYVSPQATDFNRVLPGTAGSLKLESPHTVALGVAWEAIKDRLTLEVDGKWINWGGAAGYSDFDWQDQWIVAVGAQYAIIPKKLYVRAGYNFGSNPLKNNSGWTDPLEMINVQGNMFPRYYYETFRTIGFPAIVEHHLTLGFGYEISDRFSLNVSYMHGFSNGFQETGAGFGPPGTTTTFGSRLVEDAGDFGLTFRF